MATDIKVTDLIINEMTEAKLKELEDSGSVPSNEMFFTDDDDVQGSLPLGTIIPVSIVTDDARLHLLDGSSLLQTGIYEQFCTWLKSRIEADTNNVPTCTITEYATEMTTYGQCGKFVINDTDTDQSSNGYTVYANSIKLPTITEFIASSDETRPKNIRYPYYIVVASSVKTDVEVDIDNVASDINAINGVLTKTEQVETIYDMNDSTKDWGYSGGINATTITGKDFSKYKRLRIYYTVKNSTTVEDDTWGRNNVIDLDLSKLIGFNYSTSRKHRYINYTQDYEGGCIFKVNAEKTTFYALVTDGTIATSGGVYKIEGVY